MRLVIILLIGLFVLLPVKADEPSDPVTEVVLAEKLVEYGRKHKDPESLLMATKIFLRHPSEVYKGQGTEEAEPDAPENAPSVKAPPIVLEAELLRQARAMNKQPGFLARVAALEKMLQLAGKSPRSGILRGSESVRSRHRWSTEVEFVGEEEARVEVMGGLKDQLQLVVYDENGEWIAGSKGTSANCSVSWTAARDGFYKVVVRNRGDEPSGFRFVLR